LQEGVLPDRYRGEWAGRFDRFLDPILKDGISVLDVGSGRKPVLFAETRPKVTYVGLDVSEEELRLAPDGSYDEIEVRDLTDTVPGFVDRFDLVVSWQVFEHVHGLQQALDNIRLYLKPGGWLVSLFSGRYSPMGVLNRMMTFDLARRLNHRLLDRAPDSMFRTSYDLCYASALRGALDGWQAVEIEPRWEAASYFDFSAPVRGAYLALENRLAAGGWEDLATHYFLAAQR
jgi:SAM-dependent methyltransferase